jgi:hypothetical protein
MIHDIDKPSNPPALISILSDLALAPRPRAPACAAPRTSCAAARHAAPGQRPASTWHGAPRAHTPLPARSGSAEPRTLSPCPSRSRPSPFSLALRRSRAETGERECVPPSPPPPPLSHGTSQSLCVPRLSIVCVVSTSTPTHRGTPAPGGPGLGARRLGPGPGAGARTPVRPRTPPRAPGHLSPRQSLQ